MTTVFVHGVPETPAVWDRLITALAPDDAVSLALPGFGTPRPEGFDATQETYAAWMAGELAAYEQVDLVTHDWGALLAVRVLADRPANVRSWVSDLGDLGADFAWHDMAKVWQTPGDGEAFMESFVGGPVADRAGLLAAVGVPAHDSEAMAAAIDTTMGQAILDLYRSATDIGNRWGPGIDQIAVRSLLVESMQDPFRNPERVVRLAGRIDATVVELPDAGHFWMLDSTDAAATAIADFWSTLP